jgi:type II secretion system protein N
MKNDQTDILDLTLFSSTRLAAKKSIRWFLIGAFLTSFLTMVKFSRSAQLDMLIQSAVLSQLAGQGVPLQFERLHFSFIPFFLELQNPTFQFSDRSYLFDRIRISPSLFRLIQGQYGGSFFLSQKKSQIRGFVLGKKNTGDLSLVLNDVVLEQIGILQMLSGISLKGNLSGKVDLKKTTSEMKSLQGHVQLTGSKIVFDEQKIKDFKVLELHFSQLAVDIQVEQAVLLVNKLELGVAPFDQDDVHGIVTGKLELKEDFMESIADLQVQFGFSEKVLKSFFILDQLLASAKKPNGNYEYTLTGPLNKIEF